MALYWICRSIIKISFLRKNIGFGVATETERIQLKI